MKNLSYLILITFTLFLSACSEDNPCNDIQCQNDGICIDGKCDCPDGFEGELCQEKKLLLKSVMLNGEMDESYEYNQDRTISKKVEFTNNEPHNSFTYKYTSDSIIINGLNILSNLSFSYKYNQINTDEVKFETFDSDTSAGFYMVYSQFDQDCGYSKFETYFTNDVLETETTLDITDENCSSISYKTNALNNVLIGSVETKIDNKNYYYESTRIDFLKFPKSGNPTRYFVRDEILEVIETNSYTSKYTYNDDDYPSSEIREYLNGKVEVRSFIYY